MYVEIQLAKQADGSWEDMLSPFNILPWEAAAAACYDLSLASLLTLLSDGRCLNKLENPNNNYDVFLKSHTLSHIVQ